MSYSKRFLSGILSLLFLCSFVLCFPRPATAEANAASGNSEVSTQKMISESLDLIKVLPDPKKVIAWGADFLFSFIVPKSDPNAKLLDKMSTMLAKQNELAGMIGQLQSKVVEASVIEQINDFFKADKAGAIRTYYETIRSVDSNGSLSSDEKAARRKNILISNVAGDVPLGSLCSFDLLTYSLGELLTMPYATTIDGIPYANLFELYNQWQKRTYKWEHQGYESRAAFQNNALLQYTSAVTVDKLSLTARIEALPEDQSDTLRTRLSLLNDQIARVQAMADQMKVVEREESVRYYQVPGHEKLLNRSVTKAYVPSENSNAGISIAFIKNCKGISYDSSKDKYNLKSGFWDTFASGKDIDYDWLKQVYGDYNDGQTAKTSLYDIFFGTSDGNFTKFDSTMEGPLKPDWIMNSDDSWNFVVAPTGSNALRIEKTNGWVFR